MNRARVGLAVGVVVGVAIAGWAAHRGLQHAAFFRVRQVELLGVRYLQPETVVAALDLHDEHSVFHPTEPVERRLLDLGGVIGVRVERRLPGTLRVRITEQIPLALAPGPDGLVVLDVQGRPLPYDPTQTEIDVPVVARPTPALVRTLDRIRFTSPELFAEIDWLEYDAPETIRITVGTQSLWLAADASPAVVDALEAVRRHRRAQGAADHAYDARFRGWVVVRRGA